MIPGLDADLAAEMLDTALQNYRAAADDVRKRGWIVQTTRLDKHGAPVVTDRVNESVKIQREALRTIMSLKKHLAYEAENAPPTKNALEDFLGEE